MQRFPVLQYVTTFISGSHTFRTWWIKHRPNLVMWILLEKYSETFGRMCTNAQMLNYDKAILPCMHGKHPYHNLPSLQSRFDFIEIIYGLWTWNIVCWANVLMINFGSLSFMKSFLQNRFLWLMCSLVSSSAKCGLWFPVSYKSNAWQLQSYW